MKPGKHHQRPSPCTIFCFVFEYTMHELHLIKLPFQLVIVSQSVVNNNNVFNMYSHGQKSKQKHTTKNFEGFHNHFPLLKLIAQRNALLILIVQRKDNEPASHSDGLWNHIKQTKLYFLHSDQQVNWMLLMKPLSIQRKSPVKKGTAFSMNFQKK